MKKGIYPGNSKNLMNRAEFAPVLLKVFVPALDRSGNVVPSYARNVAERMEYAVYGFDSYSEATKFISDFPAWAYELPRKTKGGKVNA